MLLALAQVEPQSRTLKRYNQIVESKTKETLLAVAQRKAAISRAVESLRSREGQDEMIRLNQQVGRDLLESMSCMRGIGRGACLDPGDDCVA